MFGLFTSANGSYEKRAYDFSFKDLDGSSLKLSEFKNNVLVRIAYYFDKSQNFIFYLRTYFQKLVRKVVSWLCLSH